MRTSRRIAMMGGAAAAVMNLTSRTARAAASMGGGVVAYEWDFNYNASNRVLSMATLFEKGQVVGDGVTLSQSFTGFSYPYPLRTSHGGWYYDRQQRTVRIEKLAVADNTLQTNINNEVALFDTRLMPVSAGRLQGSATISLFRSFDDYLAGRPAYWSKMVNVRASFDPDNDPFNYR